MHKKIIFVIFGLFCFSNLTRAQITDTIGSTVVKIDSLVGFTGVAENWPWDLCWGPDNNLWFTVGDKICRYDTTLHSVDTVFKRTSQLCNIMSIAFHPNFSTNPYIYATIDTANYYYSYSGGPIVLYRYNYSASGDSLYNETPFLAWGHPGEHCGARLMISSDNYLYCTTSEYSYANDIPGNLNGRVLRINLDGTVPSVNISGDYPITKGHRNPQGIVELPNGNIIVSEFGQLVDELNLIQEYKNYGWPAFDGFDCFYPDSCTSPTYIHEDPIDTAMRPPSGIAYYNHPAIPELQGCILQAILSFGGYQGGMVASKLNGAMDDILSDVHYFKGEYLRWRDICVSPDGKVYAITNDRNIPVIRVIYNPNYYIGIEEYSKLTFKLYPNPAEDFITIDSEKELDTWKIISVDGKVVMTGKSSLNKFQIEILSLVPGIYFFHTKDGSTKFVKT